MKNKLTIDKKTKLIYSGELFIFSIVFAVVGVLELTGVLTLLKKHPNWFFYITSFGVLLGVLDFIFYLVKKEKRENKSFFDKIFLFPNIVFLVIFDLNFFIKKESLFDIRYAISILFLYNSLNYLAQSIYHYFKPIPGLIEDKTEHLIIRRFREYDLKNNGLLLNYLDEESNKKDLNLKMISSDFYVVEEIKNNNFIGQIYFPDDGKTAHFSFNFFNLSENKEYIIESLSFLIKEAFSGKIGKIETVCDPKSKINIEILEFLNFKKVKKEDNMIHYELDK